MKHKLTLIALCIVLGLEAAQQPAQDYTQLLPPEMRGEVVQYLSSATTIDEAIKNIKSLMQANKKWNEALNNQQIVGGLIKDLAKRFTKPIPLAAAELGTRGAFEWLAQEVENKKITADMLDEAMRKTIEYFSNDDAGRRRLVTVVNFLAAAGADVNKLNYLSFATTDANLELIKLLLRRGNKQLNIMQEDGSTSSPSLKRAIVQYYKHLESTDENIKKDAKKYKTIVEFFLLEGAKPDSVTRQLLLKYGFIKR